MLKIVFNIDTVLELALNEIKSTIYCLAENNLLPKSANGNLIFFELIQQKTTSF